ncbi:hypothetical protein LC653_45960 [Nostoc sp. CHAB 5784]|uniref:hypothetical protein n=1 Tax=Nostoc mirabile TaxID=2907820 RepID=UPI001E4671D4|nr:hypothetical protein [Nostoc mirabile]MCC5670905.1 hypothetical protein [Nostoc mirabile CHAB5784]
MEDASSASTPPSDVLKRPYLTSVEEKLLSVIEQKYGVMKEMSRLQIREDGLTGKKIAVLVRNPVLDMQPLEL